MSNEKFAGMTNGSWTFKTTNDEGVEVECEVLFSFESKETHKNYIVYTDNTLDEEGNTKVYANIYDPEEEEMKLLSIETDKEWAMIEMMLEELQNALIRGIDDEEALESIGETVEERLESMDFGDDD